VIGGARAGGIFAVAALVFGCHAAEELRAQQSAGGVLLALKHLRDAPNADKAKALRGLAQAPCANRAVCEVRDACQRAYTLHVEGLALTQAARQQLRDGKSLDAAKLVGSAEQKLKQASPRVDDCTERASALQRRYKL
jgi:hypothetical protein